MADGAISFYIDHFVQTRVSKLTYGSRGSIDYDYNNPEHRKRPTFTAISGIKRIDKVFWVILSGVSCFEPSKKRDIEIINPFLYVRTSKYPKRMKFVAVIIGNLQIVQVYHLPNRMSTAIEVSLAMLPSWIRILVRPIKKKSIIIQFFLISILHLDLYSELCTIEVNLSHLWNTSNVQTLQKLSGSGVYYKVYYYVVLLFGGTEIQAQLCWKENVRSTIFGNLLILLRLTIPNYNSLI